MKRRLFTTTVAWLTVLTLAGWSARSVAAPCSAESFRSRGRALGYSLDFAEALEAFNAAAAADPEDSSAWRLAAGVIWTEMLFQQGSITVDDYLGQARARVPRAYPPPAFQAAFHEYVDRAMALGEERLRRRPLDAEAHYQVGAACALLASYTATVEGRVLDSVGAARRAYHEHQRVLELDPARADAGLIVGLYRYVVSELAAPLRLLARLAGFSGDRSQAIRLIERAAREGGDARANALFTLVVVYARERRFEDAQRAIDELRLRFPGNRLLWLEAGQAALRAGRPVAAREALEEGLARLSQDPRERAPGETARWRYAHGAALAALHESDAADRELRAALADATRDWVRGRVHKELGRLAEEAGKRVDALQEYRQAQRLCRQDHDAECAEEAAALMNPPRRSLRARDEHGSRNLE